MMALCPELAKYWTEVRTVIPKDLVTASSHKKKFYKEVMGEKNHHNDKSGIMESNFLLRKTR